MGLPGLCNISYFPLPTLAESKVTLVQVCVNKHFQNPGMLHAEQIKAGHKATGDLFIVQAKEALVSSAVLWIYINLWTYWDSCTHKNHEEDFSYC